MTCVCVCEGEQGGGRGGDDNLLPRVNLVSNERNRIVPPSLNEITTRVKNFSPETPDSINCSFLMLR